MAWSVLFLVTCFFVLPLKNVYSNLIKDPQVASLSDPLEVLTSLTRINFEAIQISSPDSRCSRQYKMLSNTTFLTMLDASNRFLPRGVLYGNFYDVGNFDECLNIKEVINGSTIYGKHCMATIPMATVAKYIPLPVLQRSEKMPISNKGFNLQILGGDTSTAGIQLGFCVPNGCEAQDMTIDRYLIFHDNFCRSKESKEAISAGAFATILIFSIIGLLAILSTSYEVYLYYTGTKPAHDVLLAYSLWRNGKKLFSSHTSPDQLLCLNGLKAMSMMWVILGHVFTSGGFFLSFTDLRDWSKKASSYFVLGASVSVDSFLAIGGLVIVYTFLKATDKGVPFRLHQYYIHRYLRLTPALAAVVLFYCTLIEYTGEGPLWSTVETELRDVCQKMWWSTLLYVQNYVSTDEQYCIGQSWYLSVDMQLFILTPLVLIPLKKWPKETIWGMCGLIIAGVVAPFVVAWEDDVIANVVQQNSMKDYYVATHARFGPYVIGMLTGYIVYRIKVTKFKISIPKWAILGIWLVLLTGLGACVFTQQTLYNDDVKIDNAVHVALHRNAWSVGVCIMIVLCILDYGGPINAFLSASVFQIITKLSYAMYITHLGIIRTKVAASTTQVVFSNGQRLFEFWSYFALTIAVSIPLCLLFESPIITLEKVIFGGTLKKKEKPKNNEV